MTRALRAIHLLFTLLVGLPLVAWTVTGLAFSCFDFESVRGTRDREVPEALVAGPLDASRAVEIARALRGPDARVIGVRTRALLGRNVHVVELAPPAESVRVDAVTGLVQDDVTAGDAAAIARRAYRGAARVVAVEAVLGEKDAPAIREPAWRVVMDDPQRTQLFVARRGGELLSWRNDAWRRFDRLWSLHVFGFIDRTSPATWPLRIAGALASVASMSGAGLLVVALARRRRAARDRSPTPRGAPMHAR